MRATRAPRHAQVQFETQRRQARRDLLSEQTATLLLRHRPVAVRVAVTGRAERTRLAVRRSLLAAQVKREAVEFLHFELGPTSARNLSRRRAGSVSRRVALLQEAV